MISPGSVLLIAALGAAQLLPPPGDGDIRIVYWELQNVTDIWLTLEPRTLKGERAPLVTFTYRFPGRRHTVAPREVEVQALRGSSGPRAELWFELDGGERVDLSTLLHRAPARRRRRLLERARADRRDAPDGPRATDQRQLAGIPLRALGVAAAGDRAWLERITPQG